MKYSHEYHIVCLTIWHHLFLKFWLVNTWFFAHWRHQLAVTCLENVRQSNIRRGKKLGFQLSRRHPRIICLIISYRVVNYHRWKRQIQKSYRNIGQEFSYKTCFFLSVNNERAMNNQRNTWIEGTSYRGDNTFKELFTQKILDKEGLKQ